MARKISVGMVYDFYPDSDDQELFASLSPDDQIEHAKFLARCDIETYVENNRLLTVLFVETEGEPE